MNYKGADQTVQVGLCLLFTYNKVMFSEQMAKACLLLI